MTVISASSVLSESCELTLENATSKQEIFLGENNENLIIFDEFSLK